MPFPNKSLILFDLDGTLIDSHPDLASSVNTMLTELGREPFPLETICDWIGNGAQTLVARALSGAREVRPDLDREFLSRSLEMFLGIYEENVCVETTTYPGVPSTLSTLQERGYRMAIVTNKPARFISPILQQLSIDHHFSLLLGGDSLDQRKPHPLPLDHARNHFGVSVDQCVMVGDSENDILAARSIAMDSIGLSYGYNYGESISRHQPTLVLDDFHSLLDHL